LQEALNDKNITKVSLWGVKYKHISWFIFHPDSRKDGGQTGGEIGVYIEFIAARLPPPTNLG